MSLSDTLAPVVVLVLQTCKNQAATESPSIRQASAEKNSPVSNSLISTPEMLALPSQPMSDGQPESINSRITDIPRQVRASNQSPADLAAQQLANRLEEEISSAHLKAIRDGVMQSDFDNALFAITAWSDEKLRAAQWSGASRWYRYLLQKKYFSTTTAGIEFFTRLEQIPRSNLQVREVYALCMALNFAGKYEYERDLRSLRALRSQTLLWSQTDSEELRGNDQLLFPNAYISEISSSAESAEKPAWALGLSRVTAWFIGLPVIALIILAIAYYVAIAQMTANIEARIL